MQLSSAAAEVRRRSRSRSRGRGHGRSPSQEREERKQVLLSHGCWTWAIEEFEMLREKHPHLAERIFQEFLGRAARNDIRDPGNWFRSAVTKERKKVGLYS